MRLLGKCPNCGTEDSITRGGKEIICESCHLSWENWVNLCGAEEKKGNKLVVVDVESYPRSVKVWLAEYWDVPAIRFITSTLNTALMVRFNLNVCFSTEGGLEGKVGNGCVELRNHHRTIGLSSEFDNLQSQRVLRWYGEALQLLFEEKLSFQDKDFGRGAILKLDPKDAEYAKKVKFFIWLALYKKARSKRFADDVFKRLDFELSQPASGNYISGLTDEQIVEFFVPPPLK